VLFRQQCVRLKALAVSFAARLNLLVPPKAKRRDGVME